MVDELIKRFLKPPFLILKIRYPAVNSLDSTVTKTICMYITGVRTPAVHGWVLTHCLLMVKSAMIIT